MAELTREILLQTLAGFEEVNRITERERRERLESMTDEQARAIFDDLCASASLLSHEEEERLMSFRHAHRIRLRQAMEKMSHALGFDPAF
jgi:hypothetical protein